MENDVSKVASIKRQHIRHARLHFSSPHAIVPDTES